MPDRQAPTLPSNDDMIAEIIAEFSQVFAFARTRWARYAEDVHPELRGVGMMVLQTILRKGPITATELSQLLDMDKAVVSRQVSKLRDLEFIDAQPAAEDRRVILLSPSPAARSALDELHAQTSDAYGQRFAGWQGEELEQLRAALHRFNGAGPSPQGPASRCARPQEAGEAREAGEAGEARE